MGQALYRKYRSKNLGEIVGQEHIISTLKNSLKSGNISHAYLFTGPRGVGKTSIARILAHEVNGLDYNEDTINLDIIEIDAASNRRIDEIRDLRDKVHIAPTSSKYKVYIIDEVHMLTKEAFSALLKTLEEPPAHVIFILATTEVHKLPETIVSRTQRYSFKPIEPAQAVKHLRYIANEENITISDEALELIAQHGDGSFRDSISLLDQASNIAASIDLNHIQSMLGIAPQKAIEALYTTRKSGNPAEIFNSLHQLEEQGHDAQHIAKQLSTHIRAMMISGDVSTDDLTLIKALLDVPSSSDPVTYLQIILLDGVTKLASHKPTPTTKPKVNEPTVTPKKPAATKITHSKQPIDKTVTAPVAAPAAITEPIKPSASFNEAWGVVLDLIKNKYNTLYGILRMAEVREDGDNITLAFKFAFHQKRINDKKNRKIITDLLAQHTDRPIHINCIVAENARASAITHAPTEDQKSTNLPLVDTISNIFGSAEVLES
jgi:DNA polymerase-3 subunit gamma/tau